MTTTWLTRSVVLILAGLLWAGPASAALDQWSSNGPASFGPISALTVDPTNPLVVYTGSSQSRLAKSTDGGASWTPMNAGLPGGSVVAIAVDPSNPSVVYAGMFSAGVYKSTNGGGNWVDSSNNNGMAAKSVQHVAVDPQNPSVVYATTTAGSANGVFKSVNGGAEWTAIGAGLPIGIVNTLAIDPTNTGVVYAGTQFGIFKSTTGGGNWVQLTNGLNPANLSVLTIAINPQNPAVLYVGTGGFGVWKSTDAGASWVAASGGFTSSLINDLAIDPTRPDVLYAATSSSGVFRTRNGGQTWTPLNAGLTEDTIQDIAISQTGTCVHAGTNVNGASGQVFDFAWVAGCGPLPAAVPPLFAAVLPSSRSVQVNDPATAFVTLINTGDQPAVGASIALPGGVAALFLYQTTAPATNLPIGSPNVPVDIPAHGSQTFLVAITPTAALAPTEVAFVFEAENTAGPTVTIVGVNTLLLSAAFTQPPDVIALALTLTGDGIANIDNGSGVFAVATANVGAGGSITVSADTGSAVLPVTLFVCRTDSGGNCIQGPATSITLQINALDTPTFSVFIVASGVVPFDPAVNRVALRFKDAGGVTRGSTSVATRTQ